MSPLSFFRKYQKTMLAVAAVGAMFAFGILPIVSDWQNQAGPGSAASADSSAISWQGVTIKEGELQNLRQVRGQLAQFQRLVAQTAYDRGGGPKSMVVPETNSEASVVESLMLAEEARKLGITIGDEAVLRHLTEDLANGTVDRNQLAHMLRENTQLSQGQLFGAMRTELAAHQMRLLANGTTSNRRIEDVSTTPGQAFDYFKRLNRRIQAEVIELPVEDFVASVGEEPSAAEVQELYDEFKDTFPSPVKPTPGFKEPARASFEWVKADFPLFLEREIEKVTDEEIKARYEQDKESYRKISLPSTGDLSLPDTEETQALDFFPGESATEDSTSTPVEIKPAESFPAETDPAQAAPAETVPAETVPAETVPTETVPSESAAPKDTDGDGPQEIAEEVVTEVVGGEAATVVEQATTEVAPAEAVAVESAVESAPAETVVIETEAEAPATNEVVAPVDSTLNAETPSSEINVSGLPPEEDLGEYQSVEEVRDEIATKIARPRAVDAISVALDKVDAAMAKYFKEYMYWDLSPDGEQGAEPASPNLKAIADEQGLVHGTIPMISAFEADEYELGRAFEVDFSTGQPRRVPFTMVGFSPSLTRFKGRSIPASDVDSRFQFWKTDQKEAYTPDLEEAKPKIVKHWKMKKAIDLAKQSAKDLYVTKLGAEQSLKTAAEAGAFGEEAKSKVVETNEFTWMSGGATALAQGQRPRISYVDGVKYPGEEFMKVATKLNSGEASIAVNYPETHVYVVYAKGVTGSDEDLRTLFWQEGLTPTVLTMARQDNMRAAAEWYINREKEVGMDRARPN